MKASFVLAAAMALLASASPLEKRKYAVHKVVATVTEFRYPDGAIAKPTGRNGGWRNHRRPHGRPDAKPTAAPEAPAPPEKKPEPEAPPAKKLPDLPEVPEFDLPGADNADKPSYAPPSPPTGGDEVSSALYSTNLHRANHSAPPLEWDDDLANSASVLASRCQWGHDTKIGGGGYGQNIAYKGSGNLPSAATALAEAISEWYNGELNLFPYYGMEPDMSDFTAWGHLTALVWKGTKKMGCACHRCPAGSMNGNSMDVWYSVCNYNPPGNMEGDFASNVDPPMGNAAYIL